MADIKRVNLEEIHKTPEEGIYITKSQKENLIFIFLTFIITFLSIIKIRKFVDIIKH